MALVIKAIKIAMVNRMRINDEKIESFLKVRTLLILSLDEAPLKEAARNGFPAAEESIAFAYSLRFSTLKDLMTLSSQESSMSVKIFFTNSHISGLNQCMHAVISTMSRMRLSRRLI